MYHTTSESNSLQEPKIELNNNPGIYIDILTDFGFKHIFGKESNKDILIDFLNALFQGRKIISDIVYNNSERNGNDAVSRNVFFDLLCTGNDGEQFIIEMQRSLQPNFMDRCVYYTSRIINEQAPPKGDNWNYKIKGVFLIAILDFELRENKTTNHLTPVEFVNLNTKELFYDKLGFIFLELRKFTKSSIELETDLDRWCYLLKHLHILNETPSYLNKKVFDRIFKLAKIAHLKSDERMSYDRNLKAQRDWDNCIKYAVDTAVEAAAEAAEAAAEAAIKIKEATITETVRNMHLDGMPIEKISKLTGLNTDTIKGYLR